MLWSCQTVWKDTRYYDKHALTKKSDFPVEVFFTKVKESGFLAWREHAFNAPRAQYSDKSSSDKSIHLETIDTWRRGP